MHKAAFPHVQFSPIISLWEFQKFKFKYLEMVLIKSRENFAAAAIRPYLLLIVLTFFEITLSTFLYTATHEQVTRSALSREPNDTKNP